MNPKSCESNLNMLTIQPMAVGTLRIRNNGCCYETTGRSKLRDYTIMRELDIVMRFQLLFALYYRETESKFIQQLPLVPRICNFVFSI